MKKTFYTFDGHLKESLKDPEFKNLWKESEPEYLLADSLIQTRIDKKISQRALAKRVKTSQAAISRIETMEANPSMSFLKRLAKALDSKLILKFE